MAWYSEKIENVISELNTNIETGLSANEVTKRLETYGQNKLNEKKKRTFLQRFFDPDEGCHGYNSFYRCRHFTVYQYLSRYDRRRGRMD